MPLRTDDKYQLLENREAIRLRIRQIGRRVADRAEFEMEQRFERHLADTGEVLRLTLSDEQLGALVRRKAMALLPDDPTV